MTDSYRLTSYWNSTFEIMIFDALRQYCMVSIFIKNFVSVLKKSALMQLCSPF